jgi:type II secretory pathway component PulK
MKFYPHCGLRIADCGLRPALERSRRRLSGSVLIVVMWIAFGVVGMALYFAHSMEMNMRAADNQVAAFEAENAIESAAVYYSNVLASVMQANSRGNAEMNMQPYMLPMTNWYQTAGVKVGQARWWVIGRDTNDMDFSRRSPDPVFGLVDEASKANLNNTNLNSSPDSTTTTNFLYGLPQMTIPLLSAIYDWTSTNATASMNGAKSPAYESLNPPYLCKATNFDTIGELRMVYGMTLDDLYWEDSNLNGALDANKNDGPLLPPNDNSDGKLDSGLLEYVTVYTQEPTNLGTTTTTPTNRVLVTSLSSLTNFLGTNFPNIYNAILPKLRTMSAPTSVLDFAMRSGINEQDFASIEPYLMGSNTMGLINVNTATAVTLGCIPGIGSDSILGLGSVNAQTILAYRQSNPGRLNSSYWLIDAMANLGTNAILKAGPWVTAHSWQYTADIAAVGHYGRGYRRVKFVFDCSSGVPLIVYRQDLTYLGWALGKRIHDQLLAGTLR